MSYLTSGKSKLKKKKKNRKENRLHAKLHFRRSFAFKQNVLTFKFFSRRSKREKSVNDFSLGFTKMFIET